RVEAHWHHVAGIRRVRSGDDDHAFGAALPRGLRLVTKIRVAREDPARLLIGILGEVSEDDDDLVLDVETLIAVVAEVLRVGDDETIAREHDIAGDRSAIRERQRQHTIAAAIREHTTIAAANDAVYRRLSPPGERRPAVLRSGREGERHAEVRHPR